MISSATMKASELNTMPLFQSLVDHANANRVTFYSIGAGGGDAGSAVSVETGTVDFSALNTAGGGLTWTSTEAAIYSGNLAGSLQFMSAATGGTSSVSTRNFDVVLERMRKDFDTYYSLGYQPQRDKGDGETHRVKVAVKRDGMDVRFRERYRSKTRVERTSDRAYSALLLGVEDNPLDVAVEFEEATPGEKKGQTQVPVVVKVPLAKLVLIPQGNFHVGRMTVFAGVRDDKGRTSEVQKWAVPVRIPNDNLMAAMGQVIGYQVTLLVREGVHDIAIAVQDDLGAKEATLKVSYPPPLVEVQPGA
jgi:hypothetical protein